MIVLPKQKRGEPMIGKFFSEVFSVASSVGAVFYLVGAAIGTWISHLYGGWSASLSVLILLIAGDYVTGLLASLFDGTGLSSRVGAKGIVKKVLILFLVYVGHRLDVAMSIHIIGNMVIYFYVTNELVSLAENFGRMGVPVPKQLVNVICVLKGRTK